MGISAPRHRRVPIPLQLTVKKPARRRKVGSAEPGLGVRFTSASGPASPGRWLQAARSRGATSGAPGRFGFAYGTLPGHPEQGEEAFHVHRDASGVVTVEIVAFSRPASLLARLGSPVARAIQQRTTRSYVDRELPPSTSTTAAGTLRYRDGRIAQRAELELARSVDYTLPELVDAPGLRYLEVEGEVEILPGVTVVPTPGHTAGHQSLVVRMGDGAVIVAGQSYDTASAYAADVLAWQAGRWSKGPLELPEEPGSHDPVDHNVVAAFCVAGAAPITWIDTRSFSRRHDPAQIWFHLALWWPDLDHG